MMRRIVSVWLNNFSLNRLAWQEGQRERPSHTCNDALPLGDAFPFALVTKDTHGVQISAGNRLARKGGVRDGMRLSDARALLPALITRPAEPEKDASVLQDLAHWCQRYSPITSVDGDDGLWLDVTGASHLFGGEAALLDDLAQRLKRMGFQNRVGLAETAGAAWAVARFSGSVPLEGRIVKAHCVAQALERFPLSALRLDAATLHLLKRFGFATIGELQAVPRVSLKRRFPSQEICEAVLYRLDQAFGHVAELIAPLRPVPACAERRLFSEPILATESFTLAFDDLLERLIVRLEGEGTGVTALTFSAYHADGGVSRVGIATARPSRDAKHLTHLFRDRIETINPGFGVDALVLSADSVEPFTAEQMSFSHHTGPGYARETRADPFVDQLVDRLANRLGAQHVWRLASRESHLPERGEVRVAALRSVGLPLKAEAQKVVAKPLRPLRLFERPEPVKVMAEIPEGPPMRFTWRRVLRRVVRSEGPERIAPEWWLQIGCGGGTPAARTRDYYRVEDSEGRRYWLFREGLYEGAGKDAGDGADDAPLPGWYMHGLFG